MDSKPVKDTTGTVTLRSMHHDVLVGFYRGQFAYKPAAMDYGDYNHVCFANRSKNNKKETKMTKKHPTGCKTDFGLC